MAKLVLIDPAAPAGYRPVRRGVVINGETIRSAAMSRLINKLVRDQMRWAERDRQEEAWVQRTLATAPPLSVAQTRMLRRVKTDLTKIAGQTKSS